MTWQISKIRQIDLDLYCVDLVGEQREQLLVLGSTLADLGILKPCTITAEVKAELEAVNTFYSGYQRALNYLSYRKRSMKEMKDYLLIRKEIPLEVTTQIMVKLEQQGYLNDQQFIQSYIQDALLTKRDGPNKLRQKLLVLGCEREAIDAALTRQFTATLREEKVAQIITKLLRKKYNSYRQFMTKAQQRLTDLGYSRDDLPVIAVEEVTIDLTKHQAKLMRTYQSLVKKEATPYVIRQKLLAKLLAQQVNMDEAYQLVDDFLHEMNGE